MTLIYFSDLLKKSQSGNQAPMEQITELNIVETDRMHCKIVFNLAGLLQPLIDLSILIPIGQWAES